MNVSKGNGKKSPTIVDHLIDPANKYWPTGLIPFDPTIKGSARITQGLRCHFKATIDEKLPLNVKRKLKKETREKVLQALGDAKVRHLEMSRISLDQVEEAYNLVLDESIKEFLLKFKEKHPDVVLPGPVQNAFDKGLIRTTEDLKLFINGHESKNENEFLAAIFNMTTEEVKSLPLSIKKETLHATLRLFQERLDNANQKMLELLLFSKRGESPEEMENRIQRRKDEAITFLKKVMDKIREYQVKKGHKKVLWLDIPSDLTHKRPFDLTEVLFYKGKYGIGKERRYFAQLILYFTQLFNFIHEDSLYLNAPESARRLQNLLNYYATGADEGRKGTEIRNIYMDHHGNMNENKDLNFSRMVLGLNKLKFSPRPVSSVLEKENNGNEISVTVKDAEEKKLFPNGFSFMVKSRCKSPESLVLKYLKKGGSFDLKHIQDRVAFEFVIDEKDLTEGFLKIHNRDPVDAEKKELLKQAVNDLQLYLCDVWHLKKFQEEDDLLGENDRENAVSSKRFKVNKMIFSKEIRGQIMPIEVQIQTLTTKLMNESPDDEAAHRNYEGKRVLETNVLNYLFPEEIFPAIGQIPQGITQDLEATFADHDNPNS